MATLDALKLALKQKLPPCFQSRPLSDSEYSAGFDLLLQGQGRETYQDFIIPQLSQLVVLLKSRNQISVLEIGPGPMSVLGRLPTHLREKIKKYTAFEPNQVFAAKLEKWLGSTPETDLPLPCLQGQATIHQLPFVLHDNAVHGSRTSTIDNDEKYDIVLFCHSMYGMKPKHKFIEQALEMLLEEPQSGMVVVFHRDGTLDLEGLVCHRTASFPNGVVSVADNDEALDRFASFIAGSVIEDREMGKTIRDDWRKVCRALGRREVAHPDQLLFSSPDIMVAFTKHAITLPELTAQVPLEGDRKVKNREANIHGTACTVKPQNTEQLQNCVQWAFKHDASLTIIGGGHSGHCLWPNVVSVDMSAFNQVHIIKPRDAENDCSEFGSLIVAEAGCNSGDIIRKSIEAGLTIPLGSRPSVGAGLWLQGGIGHLSRLHGLTSDSIIGAVIVSVDSGQILCVGHVPRQRWPAGAVRPQRKQEADLLWALKGAGTNFGVVVSVTFKAYTALKFSVRNWIIPLSEDSKARIWLENFDSLVIAKLPRNCSADVYLYWDAGGLHLGVNMFEVFTTKSALEKPTPTLLDTVLGPEQSFKIVDGVGLFDSEMYMSEMHGGHGGGKTSSYKRCLFLRHIGASDVAAILLAAIRARPSPLCYIHLLHAGGAVRDVLANDTAFGCRDWEFACVVTGVWPRNHDGTEAARSAVQWVYKIAKDLLPLSSGAYGADLGPDPRDIDLAAKAFGPNLPRLTRLKYDLDPHDMLGYAFPFPRATVGPSLIILVSGESGSGKDWCAKVWVSVLKPHLTARAVSISDAIKQEYANATGADFDRLLCDRTYKEIHRSALGKFYLEQILERPQLPEETFLNVVRNTMDVKVLFITGIRDHAPVAAFAHLVPDSRVLEVYVQASEQTRNNRREGFSGDCGGKVNSPTALKHSPDFVFDNDTIGNEAAEIFAEKHLLPFLHEDLQRLADMVRHVPNFPRQGINFRHVLNIPQQPGGLALCTSLLHSHYTGDWTEVGAIVSCEAGGFIFASALASLVGVPLILIREAGKLPPPTISVVKPLSYITSLASENLEEKRIEMERDSIPKGVSVVVVDDVLSTGTTGCAMIQLLQEAGVVAENMSVMVVAEFPMHRGRQLLHQRSFGGINVQSLLFFGGA